MKEKLEDFSLIWHSKEKMILWVVNIQKKKIETYISYGMRSNFINWKADQDTKKHGFAVDMELTT